jgi:hypothetical protein
MSNKLKWIPHQEDGINLIDWKLINLLCEHFNFPLILGKEHIDYFRGIRDAGVKEAEQVIQAINTYKKIKIYIED